MNGPLQLNGEELVACVGCGLCLPHCPTYRVTGLEIASPRGRIAAMRSVEAGIAPIDRPFIEAMQECVQCRGCDAACPSGVPFGHLIQDTRAAINDIPGATQQRWLRALEWCGYRVILTHHRVLVALSWVLLGAQRMHLVPRRFALPPLNAAALRTKLNAPIGGNPDAWLFTGCVMDAWQRPTHAAALQVLRATGASVSVPMSGGDCCGALHDHSGRRQDAQRLARRVIAAMPGDAPIVVDSAGCGAALKEYGRLLGTTEAAVFAARVRDFAEYVVERGVPRTRPSATKIVIQDPCHLRHVQKAHLPVRALLQASYALSETDDDGLCCGAGGAYSLLQPTLSHGIAERKAVALRAAGADHDNTIVCSANPGCAMQLQQAGFVVRHPAELLAEVLCESNALESDRKRSE